jgi:uncharacterized protein YndB with AHSA1/START domain
MSGYVGAVAVNERVINAPVKSVWGVLSNGWLYPTWVVGATRMRDVDGHWPEVGSRLHHSVGVWPAVINDSTEVLSVDPMRSLELRAKGWPVGEADVTIQLEDLGTRTRVVIDEDAASGPGRLVPSMVRQPLISLRNVEALRRLALLAEGHADG